MAELIKRAVAIHYNWRTEELKYTPFDGEEAGIRAMNWVRKDDDNFLWRDFPASEGWVHFYTCNEAANIEKADWLTKRMFPGDGLDEQCMCTFDMQPHSCAYCVKQAELAHDTASI